jgi:hypothetical protein
VAGNVRKFFITLSRQGHNFRSTKHFK